MKTHIIYITVGMYTIEQVKHILNIQTSAGRLLVVTSRSSVVPPGGGQGGKSRALERSPSEVKRCKIRIRCLPVFDVLLVVFFVSTGRESSTVEPKILSTGF